MKKAKAAQEMPQATGMHGGGKVKRGGRKHGLMEPSSRPKKARGNPWKPY